MLSRTTYTSFALALLISTIGIAQDKPIRGDQKNLEAKVLIDDTSRSASESAPKAVDAEKQELYRKLEKHLTGTKWVGNFTVTGKELDNLTPEEYRILSAKKVDQGEYWLLKVRIKYGSHDVTVPLPPIEILWAGKTPIITVDQLTVPGLGTFDARVVIRNNKYAGTWAHNKVGGHLFGTFSKMEAEESQPTSKDK